MNDNLKHKLYFAKNLSFCDMIIRIVENQTQVTPLNPVPEPAPENKLDTNELKSISNTASRFKQAFFQILIVCLLAAATVAIVAVLFGSFNDIFGKALGTIAMVALHAILSFSYISQIERKNSKPGHENIDIFSNAIFTLIVISFVTSVFALWEILSPSLTLKLYLAYGVLLFATVHAEILYLIREFEKKIDKIVTANYFLMAIVVLMLFLVIFSHNSALLGDMFYRFLAVFGIIDATMTISAIIMQNLYIHKHPELANTAEKSTPAHSKNFWKNPIVVLLIIYLTFQFLVSIVAGVLF